MRLLVEDGPRERLALLGPQALAEGELLALLLGTGLVGMSAEAVASRLIHDFGGLLGVSHASLVELARVPGLGVSKAARLLGAFELGRRVAAEIPADRPSLRDSAAVAAFMRPHLADAAEERFYVLCLDVKCRLMAIRLVAQGGRASCAVAPADAFRAAVREGASSVIFVHNHPSGDPKPSKEDRQLTDQLVTAGFLLGINVLDHLVVGRKGYVQLLASR